MSISLRCVWVFAVTALLTLSGCASITGGQEQSLSVETRNAQATVSGALCELSNDKGKWFASSPGSVVVRRSHEALAVICKKDGIEPGQVSVESTTKASMAGNILFGGLIGAAVDHGTGAAYQYPPLIQVLMGQGSLTAAVSGTAQPGKGDVTSGGTSPTGSPLSLDAAKARCIELGLKPNTDSFGQCIMKLSK
jgi:hypothetical protein